MPEAGDTKWIIADQFGTKEDVEDAMGESIGDLILGGLNVGLPFCSLVALAMQPIVGAVLGVGSVALVGPNMYYQNYKSELFDLLVDLSDYDQDDEVTIKQKWRYHGGHKCWYPTNVFKLA